MVNLANPQNMKAKSPIVKEKVEKINILLVDDRKENLISLSAILEDDNRTILQASNGKDALLIAHEHPLAVILLDVQMPEMDGFEVARLLMDNEKTREVAIIFVT